jgi:hypothetical protein
MADTKNATTNCQRDMRALLSFYMFALKVLPNENLLVVGIGGGADEMKVLAKKPGHFRR